MLAFVTVAGYLRQHPTHLLHAALKNFCKLGSSLLSISSHTTARLLVGEVSAREGLDFTAENPVMEIDPAKPKNPGKG